MENLNLDKRTNLIMDMVEISESIPVSFQICEYEDWEENDIRPGFALELYEAGGFEPGGMVLGAGAYPSFLPVLRSLLKGS